ncbi:MAG: chromosomal replication initiator protein DnaA [Caulobacterales bacterium]|uniref:chromosomal replication initiator protein DnaA n=1 Tax=Glycocaulis sp. TaxID=1969725 RepID=UPI003F9EDBE8
MSEVWRDVRARLRQEYGDVIYVSEIARLRVAEDASGAIQIICANDFGRAWVEDNLGARLRALWAVFDTGPRDIVICCEGAPASRAPAREARTVMAGSVRETAPASAAERAPRAALENSASPAVLGSPERAARGDGRFTFNTFMVGSANAMACTAAKAISGASTPPFNPAFFHGGYGVGKTHLLNAIAHAVNLGESGRKVLYLTAEEFLNGFQSALRARDVQPFKDQVRACDVLLIDDVHFIAGKPRTEDEFLHTIAALIGENRQVVLASHCAPSELGVGDERLRSLLRGGFACELFGPDLDLRRKIVDCKVAQARSHCPELDVPEQVRDFLAARVTSSARELEGVLNNVIVRTAYMDRPVTVEAVEEVLGDLPVKSDKRVTVDEIQKTVAAYFSISASDINSKRRTQSVVRPRHIAMYLAKTMTTRSLPDIGRRFGGRDHSTVIHAVSKITAQLGSDPVLAEDIDAIRNRLRG